VGIFKVTDEVVYALVQAPSENRVTTAVPAVVLLAAVHAPEIQLPIPSATMFGPQLVEQVVPAAGKVTAVMPDTAVPAQAALELAAYEYGTLIACAATVLTTGAPWVDTTNKANISTQNI